MLSQITILLYSESQKSLLRVPNNHLQPDVFAWQGLAMQDMQDRPWTASMKT